MQGCVARVFAGLCVSGLAGDWEWREVGLAAVKAKRMEVYFENLTAENASLDKLADDVCLLLQDAEALVKATGAQLSEESKAELENALARVKTRGERIKQQALTSARATDRIIRQYPYQSLGVVFGVGVLVGALINRK